MEERSLLTELQASLFELNEAVFTVLGVASKHLASAPVPPGHVEAMMDAVRAKVAAVEALRAEIAAEFAEYATVDTDPSGGPLFHGSVGVDAERAAYTRHCALLAEERRSAAESSAASLREIDKLLLQTIHAE